VDEYAGLRGDGLLYRIGGIPEEASVVVGETGISSPAVFPSKLTYCSIPSADPNELKSLRPVGDDKLRLNASVGKYIVKSVVSVGERGWDDGPAIGEVKSKSLSDIVFWLPNSSRGRGRFPIDTSISPSGGDKSSSPLGFESWKMEGSPDKKACIDSVNAAVSGIQPCGVCCIGGGMLKVTKF